MAGGGFDRLWVSGGGAVAVAVLRGAEVGAALYHIAWDADLLAGIETSLLGAPSGVRRCTA